MPRYIIFLITANRAEASETKDDNKNELFSDPFFQKILHEFLNWIEAEIKAERVKGGEYLLESSEETNIRVDFHDPDTAPNIKPDENDDKLDLPPPKSSVTRGLQGDMSTNIMSYYTAEFSTVNDAIAWAQSCPLSYDGFALEIRQLKDVEAAISEAPSEVKERVGDQIVLARKHLLEQGKMKKEEDGTLWVKLEDEKWVTGVVAEAEKREAEKEEN